MKKWKDKGKWKEEKTPISNLIQTLRLSYTVIMGKTKMVGKKTSKDPRHVGTRRTSLTVPLLLSSPLSIPRTPLLWTEDCPCRLLLHSVLFTRFR